MSKYVIALSPYAALERIYKRHGKDAGPVNLYRGLFMVWKYEFGRRD